MGVITRGGIQIFVKIRILQIRPKVLNIATGCTVSSDTKPRAPGTGPAGTEQPPSSSASVDFSTMRKLTLATGLKMLPDVKNIVRIKFILFLLNNFGIICHF